MLLRETALRVINSPEEFLYEDTVEAYQFINDNGLVDQLNDDQTMILMDMVESGMVLSAPWKE